MNKIKSLLKRIILSIQFFTTIPINIELKVEDKDFGKTMSILPFIGLFIGAILYCLYSLLSLYLPVYISVTLIFMFYVLLTGGLHIDGLGDTFDGVFSNRPKERVLEIMKDSRMGTNGIIAIFFVFILDIFLLKELVSINTLSIILFPVVGRTSGLICSAISNYARSNGGLGKNFVEYCTFKELILGLFFYFILFFIFLNDKFLILSTASIVSAFFLTRFFSKKIDGVTGDIIGAVIELSQTIFLILFYLYLKDLR